LMNLSQPLPLEDRTCGCFPQIPYPVFFSTPLRPITPLSAPLPTVLSHPSWYHPSHLPAKNPHRKLACSYRASHPFLPFLVFLQGHLAFFILLLAVSIPGCYIKQLITSSRLSRHTNKNPYISPSCIFHPIPYRPTYYSLSKIPFSPHQYICWRNKRDK
jgi:hypothetical protein